MWSASAHPRVAPANLLAAPLTRWALQELHNDVDIIVPRFFPLASANTANTATIVPQRVIYTAPLDAAGRGLL